ncbi:VOC family protein [Brachybacterium sp. JHP9]|uniref:VOC family protein n=1 Tax=Brachybacterium equifaecis TaxID=2910770 RepID=A0ABT0R333_9MICO|nr:VOC family protein [Brachybacterium equifaecis]
MAPQFSPYIAFPGTAAEAFDHYRELFGGELMLTRYRDFDTSSFPFEVPGDAVAHAQLEGGLVTLAGGDSFGEGCHGAGPQPLASDVYSFLIGMEDVQEAKDLAERIIAAGGELAMPIELAPWGDHYGQVKDRYGVLFALVVPGPGHGREG